MKKGSIYAARLKKAYARLRPAATLPEAPLNDNPVRQLAIAVLAKADSEKSAEAAVHRMLNSMVDWNEIRVSNAAEIMRAAGGTLPAAPACYRRLIEALQSIYQHENRLSLDRLSSMGRRDARQFLEQLAGVDAYAAASVTLWSLGGHAIPVNDRLLAALRQADLVHPTATVSEVQAFLERHVAAADAKEFCLVMQTFADQPVITKKAPAKRIAKTKKTSKTKSRPKVSVKTKTATRSKKRKKATG